MGAVMASHRLPRGGPTRHRLGPPARGPNPAGLKGPKRAVTRLNQPDSGTNSDQICLIGCLSKLANSPPKVAPRQHLVRR